MPLVDNGVVEDKSVNQPLDGSVQYQVPPQAFPGPPTPEPPQKQKNVVGLIGFIVAIVGFVFACVPGLLIGGWVLLPVGFILSVVGLCLSGKAKGLSVSGLIISVVGAVVGFVVFFAVVVSSFDEAFGGGETTARRADEVDDVAVAPHASEEPAEESPAKDEPAEEGTRANPYPLGTVVSQGDWDFTVNGVNLEGTEQVLAENPFNEAPDAGYVYIVVNVTATYTGANPDGDMPWATVNYVTTDGNTIDGFEKLVVAPDEFDDMSTLYEGASSTGNVVLQVPADSAGDGVLAVNPTMMGDKVFFAVR